MTVISSAALGHTALNFGGMFCSVSIAIIFRSRGCLLRWICNPLQFCGAHDFFPVEFLSFLIQSSFELYPLAGVLLTLVLHPVLYF